MPSMFEIYDNHAFEYDELVSHEDHEGNLKGTLHRLFDFRGKSVIELGVGTGRVTAMYIDLAERAYCFDRAQHMMDRAAVNLADYKEKLRFGIAANMALDTIRERADCVIEGWAFGHTAGENLATLETAIAKIVGDCDALCEPGGSIILIETLGSNVTAPAPPSESLRAFYALLETSHGFTREVVRTDYRFASVEEARRIFSFFFGLDAERAKLITSPIIPEFTGVWHRRKP